MRGLLPLPLLVAAACCAEAPTVIVTPERVDPPVSFAEAYASVEVCLGRAGDFEAVRWWVANDLWRVDAPTAIGLTAFPNDIYLYRRLWDELQRGETWPLNTVRHESIHHVLQSSGHGPAFHRCEAP